MTDVTRSCFSCLAAAVACLAMLAACGANNTPREITLIARGMTFVLADDLDTPNPVIELRAGEQVRLVLKNEAPGLLHDIEIPAWEVRTKSIRAGQSTEVMFTVPSALGRTEYRCRPHAELMHGFVEVAR